MGLQCLTTRTLAIVSLSAASFAWLSPVALADGAIQLTTDPALDSWPAWSPDGTQIAFISNRSGNNDIWVIPAAGGSATQITTNTANDR